MKQQPYEAKQSPIHYCENASLQSDDNVQEYRQQQPTIYCNELNDGNTKDRCIHLNDNHVDETIETGQLDCEIQDENNEPIYQQQHISLQASTSAAAAAASAATASTVGTTFNHQLTTDMCSYKNSKSRRLEYSLKCLKYGRSNPSQDSAFGSLTDNDLSISSFRLNSFQSISSPIDEGVEDIIIATTTAGNKTCLELATIPRSMVSQDSAISSPCRESSPNNFLNIDDAMSGSCSGASSSSDSTGNIRPQQFPVSLSPKILVTATTNSSNSSLSSISNPPQHSQQFDPPKILVNDQNSIYTTSPSKRSGTIEVFSQKYRVSSFEDMKRSTNTITNTTTNSDKHLKNVNRLAFRSLEEERRIDNAFMPISDRTNSDNRVNMQSEKYKKLTHASFRISKTSSQVNVFDTAPVQFTNTTHSSNTMLTNAMEMQRPATAAGTTSNRQTMWRDSKFYRKNHIAKSNDSLLETSPNHSARLSPSSLRDNHYDSCSSYGSSRSHSRQSLNRGCSINEIMNSNQTLGMGLTVTTSFCGSANQNERRYCSSKSEDLGESNDYLRVMDARKSYSERHLVTLTKLKQTAINNKNDGNGDYCHSEDEMSFNDDNNAHAYQITKRQQQQKQQHNHHHQQRHFYQQQQQQQQQQQNYNTKRPHPNQLSWSSCSINRLKTTNIKTTSLATLSCQTNLNMGSINLSSSASSASTSAASSNTSENKSPYKIKSGVYKSFEQISNITDSSVGGECVNGGGGGSSICITTEENSSSPEESPSHQTLSGSELPKIFAMDETQSRGSSCSEEKTPLLDSVEMSPISPAEPESDNGDDKM